jgi:hypothetical protein
MLFPCTLYTHYSQGGSEERKAMTNVTGMEGKKMEVKEKERDCLQSRGLRKVKAWWGWC